MGRGRSPTAPQTPLLCPMKATKLCHNQFRTTIPASTGHRRENYGDGRDYTFLRRRAAFALASTCAGFLQPGMTHDTSGFFKHHASAHCPMGIPHGTSDWRIRSTSARSFYIFDASTVARTSLALNAEPGRYLPVSNPLASGTRARMPRLFCSACEKTVCSGRRSSRL